MFNFCTPGVNKKQPEQALRNNPVLFTRTHMHAHEHMAGEIQISANTIPIIFIFIYIFIYLAQDHGTVWSTKKVAHHVASKQNNT